MTARGNFTGCENSQLEKFRSPAKFPAGLDIHAFAALLSFWFMIRNAELNSGSLCLN